MSRARELRLSSSFAPRAACSSRSERFLPIEILDASGSVLDPSSVRLVRPGPWPDGLFGCARDEGQTSCAFEDQLVGWTRAERRELKGRTTLRTLEVHGGGVCLPTASEQGAFLETEGVWARPSSALRIRRRKTRIELVAEGRPVDADVLIMPFGIEARARSGVVEVETGGPLQSVAVTPRDRQLAETRWWASVGQKNPRDGEAPVTLRIEVHRRKPLEVLVSGAKKPTGWVHGWTRLAGSYDFELASSRALEIRHGRATISGLIPGNEYLVEIADGDRGGGVPISYGMATATVKVQPSVRIRLVTSNIIDSVRVEDRRQDETQEAGKCWSVGRPWKALEIDRDGWVSVPVGPRRCLIIDWSRGPDPTGQQSAIVVPAQPGAHTFELDDASGEFRESTARGAAEGGGAEGSGAATTGAAGEDRSEVHAAPEAGVSWVVDWSPLVKGALPKVIFVNRGTRAWVIAPQLIRIGGEGIERVPYPGPPIDPAGGAFSLGTGARVEARYRIDAALRLAPGKHRVTASYRADEGLVAGYRNRLPPGDLWTGAMEAETVLDGPHGGP